MYRYEFTSYALRDLRRLPKDIQKRIFKKLDFYVMSGQPLSFAHSLMNYELGQYRFRIGDYRVVFNIDEEMITILAVGHRREIYK